MRISLLVYQLRVGGGLEVGRNVVAALARVAAQHAYQLILPAGVGYEGIAKPPDADCLYFRRARGAPGQFLFERFSVPRAVRQFRPDWIWGMASSGLAHPPAPQAILFHKPHFIYGGEHGRIGSAWERLRNGLARRRLMAALPSTRIVFCQTRTAAARFPRFTGYRGRVALMPNAVSRMALAGNPAARPEVFSSLSGKFVLFCLTRYYPHKNLESLCETFERHGDGLRDVVILLTIAAEQHPRAAALLRRISNPGLQPHFINVGPLPPDALAGYYTHSDGLILPTLLESFSGTYLEAMQFRRPILTSDLDFAREVCGPAASYFDPRDAAQIASAIRTLRDDPRRAAHLIEAGATQFGTYVRDWDEIVRAALGEIEAAHFAAAAASET